MLRRSTPLGRLTILVGLQLLFSAAFVTYFSQSFDYGERLIVLHVSVVGAVMAFAALALSLVLWTAPRAAARFVIGLAPACGFALLALLYGADLLSNRLWGHNVTYELAARYAARPAVLARYISVVAAWLTVAATASLAVAGALYLAFSGVVMEGLAALVALPRKRVGGAWTAFGLLAAAGLLSAGTALALAMSIPPAARFPLLEREPLIGFFVDDESAHQFAISRIATRFHEEGPAARAHYPKDQAFRRRNVVIIVADSLRPDHMGLYGYQRPTTPFLDRLGQSGKLRHVRLALASCPETNCGISSIMASKTFGSMVPQNFKLHELLRDQGYAVNFVLSGDHQWIGLRQFYGDELTLYFDGHSSHKFEPTDDRVIFEGLDLVPRFGGTPAFFFFHLMSAHEVGYRLDPYVRYQPSRPNGFWGGDTQMRVNSYDNGVVQADALIEQLFHALDEKGYLDDALVVILADHGEGLGEHPGDRGFGHGALLYQEFLRIPFLIYDQAGGNYSNLDFAAHVDVAPTIVDRLGLQVPPSWEGRSLLEPEIRPYSYHYVDRSLSVHARFPFYAVVHPTGGEVYKYIRHPDVEELFELTSDPDERRNLIWSANGAILSDLRARLVQALASATP